MPDLDPEDWERILVDQECGAVVDLLRARQPSEPPSTPPLPQPMSIQPGVPMLRSAVFVLILVSGTANGQGW